MSPSAPSVALVAATGPFLASKLGGLARKVGEAVPRVVTAADDEAVHDLRVAIRRTRTVLEVGRDVLGRFHADEVRRSLREVHRATGALRDEEVMLDLVEKLVPERSDVHAWLDVRRRRERVLRRALTRLVRAGRIDRSLRLLEALLVFPIKPSREQRLDKFARRSVERAQRAVAGQPLPSLDDVDGLHRLRITYKRLRYTVEIFGDALPEEARALGALAAKFQARLGNVHDVDIAVGAVLRARALPEGARHALIEALRGARAERTAAFSALAEGASVRPLAQASGTVSLRKTSTF